MIKQGININLVDLTLLFLSFGLVIIKSQTLFVNNIKVNKVGVLTYKGGIDQQLVLSFFLFFFFDSIDSYPTLLNSLLLVISLIFN